ncbi:hypothetical protein Ct61P_06963 [Colletotrichum tofieldiae]|nr:hypothetical protein Ct61P_06963 [Colletotrichum tofieldiae]
MPSCAQFPEGGPNRIQHSLITMPCLLDSAAVLALVIDSAFPRPAAVRQAARTARISPVLTEADSAQNVRAERVRAAA